MRSNRIKTVVLLSITLSIGGCGKSLSSGSHRIHNYQDLRGADFSSQILNGDEFVKANLEKANFSGVFADNVNFSGANLQGANLSSGSFKRANFQDADLRKANLRESDFNEAFFSGASFVGAQVEEADFRDATGISGETLLWLHKSGAKTE